LDISDLSAMNGTLPGNNSLAVAGTLFVVMEGARTMTNLVGDDRFTSPYGGELMGASYTATLGMLTSFVVKSPLPALAALGSVVFFVVLYHWQENKAVRFVDDRL
jgi:hypothetical protein